MQNSIVIKRLKAFVIDYLIILIYIGMLFGGTILISKFFWNLEKLWFLNYILVDDLFLGFKNWFLYWNWRKYFCYCNVQLNLNSYAITLSWDLDGCARWCKVTITVTIKLTCTIIFKGIQRVPESNSVGAWMAARGGAGLHLQLQ